MTENAPTYCEHCEHMHPSGKNSRYAVCMKHPRLDSGGFVTEHWWDKDSPYMYCVHINGGACPLFEPKRESEE